MVNPDALAMIEADPSHADAKGIMESPDNVIRFLDANDIERACCINYVSPDVMGFPPEVNDWIAKFTRNHRDRLFPVGSVNPRHTRDVRTEANRILDLGIRMVKVHPPHQLFSPNAYRHELPQLADLYTACAERGVPVMIHTGTSVFPRARNVYADPMPIDDVAVDFPKLKIVIAHAGRPLYGETAFFLARRHDNVFLEISGIPPKSLPRYVPRLASLADKVLWGTDWPSMGVASPRRNVDEFRSVGYGEEIERKILRENADRLFAAPSF